MEKNKTIIEQKNEEKIKSCPVCCEIFTKNLRKEMCCSYCKYSCCTNCMKTYIFSTMTEPNCMNCRKRFSREIIFDNFSKKFINTEYKIHRENTLFEQEISMMPSTQNIIELKNQNKDINQSIFQINSQIADLEQQRAKLYEKIDRHNYIYNNPATYYQDKKEIEKQTTTFIKPCPRDSCRGFLSSRYMCGVCGLKVCAQCHEIKEEHKTHTCDPTNIESVKLIKSDSKGCPKCGVSIFKISGCFHGDTDILMYNDNIKKISDIVIGDVVQGIDKSPRIVTDIFNGEDFLFSIKHTDSLHFENYIVNSKHELVLKYIHHKYHLLDEKGILYVKWYDKKNKMFHNKIFENASKEFYNEIKTELNNVSDDDVVVITVDDFLKLDYETQKNLFAISVKKFLSSISIQNLSYGKYYGFRLAKDPFFLLPSGTIVSNCSQIWCTACKTAFDWKSGNIINGPIHNPHYFDYLRSVGREDEEIQRRFNDGIQGINCLNWNQLSILVDKYRKNKSTNNNFINDIFNLSRHINHIRDYVLNTELTNNYNNPEEVNADLRIHYLQNYISKDIFKLKIQRRDKRNSFNQNLREVVEMYADVLSDTLLNFNNNVMKIFENKEITEKEITDHLESLKCEFITEIINLNMYTKKNSEKIMNDYNYTSIPIFLFTPTHITNN